MKLFKKLFGIKDRYVVVEEQMNVEEVLKQKFNYVEAETIKPVQIQKELLNERRAWKSLGNHQVDFILFGNGSRGLRVHFEDGGTQYYRVGRNGEIQKLKYVRNEEFVVEDTSRKLERLFGISDEMRLKPDWRIDAIHAVMFLTGFALIGGLVLLGIYLTFGFH